MKNRITNNSFTQNKVSHIVKFVLGVAATATLQLSLPSSAMAQETGDLEVIQVSGIRSSLEKATEVKRSLTGALYHQLQVVVVLISLFYLQILLVR